uniref:Uncharacterized protein n=1 Tax=Strongyloides venezuelensis TaxID=75913 RepID=A0A0K0FHE5_STRVS
MPPAGVEPATLGLLDPRSNRLSYGGLTGGVPDWPPICRKFETSLSNLRVSWGSSLNFGSTFIIKKKLNLIKL